MSSETGAALGNIFQNPAVLGAIQGRLNSLVGRSSGYVESLPADVKRRLNALKNLQDKHTTIEAQFREEVIALEKKYLKQYQPLYDKRAAVIQGLVEPSDEECKREPEEAEEAEEEKQEEAVKTEAPSEPVKGVPEFWLTILKNHPLICELVTEKDEEALKSLTDIKVSYLDDKPGFKLEFCFGENEFFTDSVLTKTYVLLNSPDAAYGDVVYDHAEGSEIHWKEGKDLSVTVEIKKQRHKVRLLQGTNKTRTIKKTVPADTFFQFFNPPKPPAEEEDADEDELQELDAKLENDYEVGEIIKEKLIPRAIDWFTGKALEYEEGEYDEDDMGDWYGEEDDEEGDDDDDDDEDGAGKEGASTEKPPECKQQ
ncbi:hypothetical protein HK104_009093 [Borealophlyctis nickersoniae]|nr:hypothetical protein HK104_009093 [Borealophlyctis nickersoniae]